MLEESNTTIGQRLGSIEKALQEHDALLRVVYEHTKKTQNFIAWGRVMSMVYLVLIIAPLIFAAFYLPPLLKQYMGTYQELLEVGGNVPGNGAMMRNFQEQLKIFNNTQ